MTNNWEDIHWGFSIKEYFWISKTNQQVWESLGFSFQEAKEWVNVGLEPHESDFAAYLRGKGYQPTSDLNLEELKEEFDAWWKSKTPQEYLDIAYHKERRNTIKELEISFKNLEGNLDLSDFPNLEELGCSNNELTKLKLDNCLHLRDIYCPNSQQLTNLDITNCKKLERICCFTNHLPELKLPLVAEQLTRLNIANNNLSERDLSMFSHLVNLEELQIGNGNQNVWDKEKISQGIYNRFSGSLQPLQKMTKLESLNINNTDIDSGLEYLPSSLKELHCLGGERPQARVREIYRKANDSQEWTDGSYKFKFVRGWSMNEHYPVRLRIGVKSLSISGKLAKGLLDFSDFVNLKTLDCSNNQITQLDKLCRLLK